MNLTPHHTLSAKSNQERSRHAKIDNNSSERVEEFKYLGTTLTNQNSIQNEVRECLLPLGAEPFVFQFAIQKFKDKDIQKYNFACCFVWL